MAHRYRLAPVLVLLVASSLFAQTPPKNFRSAESTYRDLSTMTLSARKVAFKALPAEMQDEVWLTHLRQYLAARPDLTDGERSVIYEAMGLLSAGLHSVGEDDASWALKVYRPMQTLEVRAYATCRRDVIREAFGVLGPGTAKDADNELHTRVGRIAPLIGPSWGPCDCNLNHDFCGDITSPISCQGLSCTPSDHGCGWLWYQECNGICF